MRLLDRAKDGVVSGGENISTVGVEQALASHGAVLEAAVIGVPDEKWGERPKAFVVLKPGEETSEEEMIDHMHSAIARYKAPKAVAFPGRAAKDLDEQGPEVRAPGARVGRARLPDQGVRPIATSTRSLPDAAQLGRSRDNGEADGATPFPSLLKAGGGPPEVAIDPPNDLVALPYSSGTTELSKGVMLTPKPGREHLPEGSSEPHERG